MDDMTDQFLSGFEQNLEGTIRPLRFAKIGFFTWKKNKDYLTPDSDILLMSFPTLTTTLKLYCLKWKEATSPFPNEYVISN